MLKSTADKTGLLSSFTKSMQKVGELINKVMSQLKKVNDSPTTTILMVEI